MNKNYINCPNCDERINVSEALYSEIENELKSGFDKKLAEKEAILKDKESKMKKELEAKVREEASKEFNKEKELLQAKLKIQTEEIRKAGLLKAELEKMKKDNAANSEKIRKETEAMLRKKMEAETEKLKAKMHADAERRQAESDLKLKQMKKLLIEAKEKAEQGSMQLQGEAQEVCIEQWLKKTFRSDEILEVKKGVKGADCIHKVIDSGEHCATIFYESKRTKMFQNSWISKLKSDMRDEKASIGILVTETMPAGAGDVMHVNGIWICSYKSYKTFVMIIRDFTVRAYFASKAGTGKSTKMEKLFEYLTSNEFRRNVETMFGKITEMGQQLEKDKSDSIKSWKKREEHIDGLVKSASGIMFGIKKITGTNIPELNGSYIELN